MHEYRLRLAGREWSILHEGEVLSWVEEQRFLSEARDRIPYGATLWPSAIALAHEVAARGDAWGDRRILELGAGTGLPGIVAASFGARVVQTDRDERAMLLCKENGARNGVRTIEYRVADWSAWEDAARYDWIIGSDVLYRESLHQYLRTIFESNLAPGGRVLVSDPFRSKSLPLLEAMESDGWTVALTKWTVGDDEEPTPIGVFELSK